MNQNRRSFIKLLASFSAISSIGGCSQLLTSETSSFSSNLLLSAFDDHSGQHFIGLYDLDNAVWVIREKVDFRYHSALVQRGDLVSGDVISLNDQFLFVSRRPGNKATLVDQRSRSVVDIVAEEGHHFYGHAAEDGQGRIWLTENNYKKGRGLLSCRSKTNLNEVVKTIDLNGIGPHQLCFFPDGKHAAVGLGGIETHPDFPRKKLNLDSMQSELLIVDIESGEIISRAKPPHPQLSLRHLDVTSDDSIVIGAQFQGPKYEQFPLLYFYRADTGLQALDAPDAVWESMNHYIASVTVKSTTKEVVVSCPRANTVHLFSLLDGTWKSAFRMSDPGGVVVTNDGDFVISCGSGELMCLSSNNGVLTLEQQYRVGDTRWDNHMGRVVLGLS